MAPLRAPFAFRAYRENCTERPKTKDINAPPLGVSMFSLSRSAFSGHAQTLFTVAEATFASMIVFGAGLAFGATIGFF